MAETDLPDANLHQQTIQKEYHPIPLLSIDLDQMAIPLVLPAMQHIMRYDPTNVYQATYIDLRRRCFKLLKKVIKFKFKQVCIGKGNGEDVYGPATMESSSYWKVLRNLAGTFIEDVPLVPTALDSGGGGIEARRKRKERGATATQSLALPNARRAIHLIQEAYAMVEMAHKMTDIMINLIEKAKRTKSGPVAEEGEPLPTQEQLACPRDMVWCCSYSPTGIKNSDWVVERSILTYVMFCLSLQLCFVDLHTSRPSFGSKFFGGKGEEATRSDAVEINSAYWIPCQILADKILQEWHTYYYGKLADTGLLPSHETFTLYRRVVDLIQLDYTIFHFNFPMFSRQATTATKDIWRTLFPTDSERKVSANYPEKDGAKKSALISLLSLVSFAKDFACAVSEQVVTIKPSVYTANGNFPSLSAARGETSWSKLFGTGISLDDFINGGSLKMRQRHLDGNLHRSYTSAGIVTNHNVIQLVKYIMQAVHVYESVEFMLRASLDWLFENGGKRWERHLDKRDRMLMNPVYCMFLLNNNGSVTEVQHNQALINELNRVRGNITRSTPNTLDDVVGTLIDRRALQESQTLSLPWEFSECDILFSIWKVKCIAQFPVDLINQLHFFMADIHDRLCAKRSGSTVIFNFDPLVNPKKTGDQNSKPAEFILTCKEKFRYSLVTERFEDILNAALEARSQGHPHK